MRNRVICNDRLQRAAGNSSFDPLTCDFLVSRASLEGRKRVSRLDNRRLLDPVAYFLHRFAFRVSAEGILITRLIKDNRPITVNRGEGRGKKKGMANERLREEGLKPLL